LDATLVDALEAAVSDADADPRTRVLVIAGNGPSFCSGADLAHLLQIAERPGQPTAFLATVSAAVTRLERVGKPVIAALHGHAVAGGLEIALGCDIVVAATGTLIGDGHVRNGLLPAAGSSVRLPAKVGAGLARRLMLTGELLPAAAFVPSGWVQSIVDADELEAEVERHVERLVAAPRHAQRHMKALLADLSDLPPTAGLGHELEAFAHHWASTDVPEHLDRFLNRQTPTL
jgi:enoyl-CoA hydratase/carnithine racemase